MSDHHATYHYVECPAALAALVERMARANRIALDTEADSLHSYYEKVCLIQLSFEGETFVVDPLAGMNLSPLLALLTTKPLLMHGADYDLRMMRSSFQFRPRGEVHDTQVAAQLLGIQEFGLAALARRVLGTTLTKSAQKADWSRRPLAPDLLAYAADDVRHLEPIAARLLDELRGLGRYEWYRASCERLVEASLRDRPRDPDEAWRIKGLRGLTRHQLAFVRELWLWREHEAQQADVPPFKVLGNAQLRDLALWASAHPSRPLGEGPRLPRNCTGRRLAALEKAIAHARHLPKDQWPELRKSPLAPRQRDHEREKRVDALMSEVASLAQRLGMAPSLLASRATLEAVVARQPRSPGEVLACRHLLPWQAELLMSTILKVLATAPPKE